MFFLLFIDDIVVIKRRKTIKKNDFLKVICLLQSNFHVAFNFLIDRLSISTVHCEFASSYSYIHAYTNKKTHVTTVHIFTNDHRSLLVSHKLNDLFLRVLLFIILFAIVIVDLNYIFFLYFQLTNEMSNFV